MSQLKPIRLIVLAVALTGAPLAAFAQTQPSMPPAPSASPPTTQPEASPLPPAAVPQRPVDKSVTAPAQAKSLTKALVGLAVFSSDGSRMGTVQSVSAAPDGSVKAILIKTGGFLGFGTRLVAIPEGHFTKSGDAVQLGMTADEVSKLPEFKQQS
jgi:hypothetical protein